MTQPCLFLWAGLSWNTSWCSLKKHPVRNSERSQLLATDFPLSYAEIPVGREHKIPHNQVVNNGWEPKYNCVKDSEQSYDSTETVVECGPTWPTTTNVWEQTEFIITKQTSASSHFIKKSLKKYVFKGLISNPISQRLWTICFLLKRN